METDSDVSAVKGNDYRDRALAKEWEPEDAIVAEVNVQKADVVGAN